MANIPSNLILVWTSTNASIPSGWSRETSLDNKYPKGSATPNITGGTSTHSHSSVANHSHTLNHHTHTISIATAINGGATGPGADNGIDINHSHSAPSVATTSGGTTDSIAVTYSSISNDPPYKTVIFIKSGTNARIADGIAGFWNGDSSLPTGFYNCDGTNGTPDYRGKYLKGANTGADAGTTGGSTTNTHTLIHTHTPTSHSHTTSGVSGSASGTQRDTASGSGASSVNHTHTVTINNATDSITNNPSVVCSETVEPLHKKLTMIMNKSGGSLDAPLGIVGLYLGAIPPKGWRVITDMQGYHLKIADDTTQNGNTGGSNTHTHTNNTHTHTGSHNHTAPNLTHTSAYRFQNSGATGTRDTSTHAVTVESASTTYSNGTTSANSSNNEPEYITISFVEYKGSVNPGVLMYDEY